MERPGGPFDKQGSDESNAKSSLSARMVNHYFGKKNSIKKESQHLCVKSKKESAQTPRTRLTQMQELLERESELLDTSLQFDPQKQIRPENKEKHESKITMVWFGQVERSSLGSFE